QITLDAFRTEHALVEREVLPRLEADDLVVLDLELDAALLAAEAAVSLDEMLGLRRRFEAFAAGVSAVRTEAGDGLQQVGWFRRHSQPHSRPHSAPWATPTSSRRQRGQIH